MLLSISGIKSSTSLACSQIFSNKTVSELFLCFLCVNDGLSLSIWCFSSLTAGDSEDQIYATPALNNYVFDCHGAKESECVTRPETGVSMIDLILPYRARYKTGSTNCSKINMVESTNYFIVVRT